MQTIHWRTNFDGTVAVSGIHDGHIESLRYENGSSLTVTIRQTTGRQLEFVLDRTREVNLRLLNGSIVSEIYIWKVDAVPNHLSSIPDSGWNALFGDMIAERDRRGVSERIVARNPDAFLFQVDCSYGGALACIAERIGLSTE